MTIVNQIDSLIEETLVYIAKNNYKSEIERALIEYKRPFANQVLELDVEQGFNSWFIHDYKKKDDTYIISDYLKNRNLDIVDGLDLFKAINESVFSIFKVSLQRDNVVFKDIITQADYIIDTDREFKENDIIKVRVYPGKSKYHIVDSGTFYSVELEETVRKSVMSKYNEFCSSNQPVTIAEFVKTHSVLVYHLANIIDYYESELSGEDELSVFVATYALKNKEEAVDKLLVSGSFQILEQYPDELVLVLLSEEQQIAEVVISVDTVEIEATSKTFLEYSKSIFEETVLEYAVFIKDEELHLEDLI